MNIVSSHFLLRIIRIWPYAVRVEDLKQLFIIFIFNVFDALSSVLLRLLNGYFLPRFLGMLSVVVHHNSKDEV